MKEQIYTIPINEAYDTDCECPLCLIEKRLEVEEVDYALGAAMMEPDYRVNSNAKGFCNKHLSLMFEKQNKLSLALLLDTHLEEIRKTISDYGKKIPDLSKEKKSLFKKSNSDNAAEEFSKKVGEATSSCVICEKLNKTMERYIGVMFYMWNKDDEFKEKFKISKGLCLKHFGEVAKAAEKHLHGKAKTEFLKTLIQKEEAELSRIQEDIHKFTLKFDYRNKDMEWGTAVDAPSRTVEKLRGYINNSEE